jgi:hypothetical protein
MIRCFEALLGWEFVVTHVTVRGLLHLHCPPPLEGEKNWEDTSVPPTVSLFVTTPVIRDSHHIDVDTDLIGDHSEE